jgi:DNA helicase-2/ATP-dependent DNA helicase PcrA
MPGVLQDLGDNQPGWRTSPLSRNSYYTTTLQAEFIKRKIPFVVYGGRKFMEAAHIKDLISAMRVVNNKDDELAWMRYLMFWEGVGEVKAMQIFERLAVLPHIENCILELKEAKYNFSNQNIYLVLDAIYHYINNVQNAVRGAYELMLARMAVNYKQDWEKKRKQDFPVLEELAKNYSTIGEFITEMLLDATLNQSPVLMNSDIKKSKNDDHVVVSTIHSAKGLEADVCFVLNVSPGAYPASRTMEDFDEMEEERRILYVALTRAKNNLVITRNIRSIHANSLLLNDKQEQYFLNGFPNDLCVQSAILKEGRMFSKRYRRAK